MNRWARRTRFCAVSVLDRPVVVAFVDTLFRADFTIDPTADGVLFVKRGKPERVWRCGHR